MADPELLERLSRHRALGPVPEAERVWLAEHGVLETLAAREIHIRKGEQATALHIVLTGHLVIHVDRGAGSQKIFEWQEGDVGGLLPYSRGASPPNDIVAERYTEVLAISREWLPELTQACPTATTILVHLMVDRARHFTWRDLRDERLLSLGRLAAGLAHELANPASAAVRGARMLPDHQAAAEAAALQLVAARLSNVQRAAIESLRSKCATPATLASLGPLERADREEHLARWLARSGVSERCAVPLAEAGLTPESLQELAAAVPDDALEAALQWVAAGCAIRSVASTVETSTSRIQELVTAVRGFTYLGHAPTAQPVDIRRGLNDTLTMLSAKTRARSASISIRCAEDLPPAQGVGAELNQVWMNLLDNALDAIGEGGRIDVTAEADIDRVVVRIVDNGPGIPEGIRERIFEPFFTTKAVGMGTGLGLDIVRRLLQPHDGRIELDSRPGRTEFRVSLPIAPAGPL